MKRLPLRGSIQLRGSTPDEMASCSPRIFWVGQCAASMLKQKWVGVTTS
jgi:hypothetical protein